MKEEELLEGLEEIACQLSIAILYENLKDEELNVQSGSCLIRGEKRLIVERSLSTIEKARVVARELGKEDLDGIFLRPLLRHWIDELKGE